MTLRTSLWNTQTTLSTSRLALLATTRSILTAHRDLLETMIRVLEQTKYGSVQREVRARAEVLVVVAGGWEVKLRYLTSFLSCFLLPLAAFDGCVRFVFSGMGQIGFDGMGWDAVGADVKLW